MVNVLPVDRFFFLFILLLRKNIKQYTFTLMLMFLSYLGNYCLFGFNVVSNFFYLFGLRPVILGVCKIYLLIKKYAYGLVYGF